MPYSGDFMPSAADSAAHIRPNATTVVAFGEKDLRKTVVGGSECG